ncbi:MAG: hypothetical protein ACTSUE_23140, partial [Promethearchaeota archaeon]
MMLVEKEHERYLDEELEEDFGMKDYQIDSVKLRSRFYLESEAWARDIPLVKKHMDYFLAGLSIFSFVLLVIFCFVFIGIAAYLLIYIFVQGVLLYWRFAISPVRYHDFPDIKAFIRYRGYLTQGPRLKSQLKDGKYKIIVFMYLLLNGMVFGAMIDSPRLIGQLNNIIFDRGNFPDPASQVTTLIPGLLGIGVIVNIFGALLYQKYKRKDPLTGKEIPSSDMKNFILVVVITSFILLFLVGVMFGAESYAFWRPSPTNDNLVYYFIKDDNPLFRTRFCVLVHYSLVFAGGAVLSLLIVLGLTAFETALIHRGTNRDWARREPIERNWEYSGTAMRHEITLKKKINARKRALMEIGMMCLAMVTGMWLFLKWGGEIMGLDWMNYLGYAVLGLAIIYSFFISPFVHAKKDGKFHYPTRKHNGWYAGFDERGLGSLKYYFREVLGKKKKLVLWTLYWMLMLVSVFNFGEINVAMINWKSLFSNPGAIPEGVFIDASALIGGKPAETALSVILVATGLTAIAFIGALGKRKEEFGGSQFWCIFYKVVIGTVLVGCFFWVSIVPQVTAAVDLLSMDFLLSLSAVIAVFGIAVVLLLFFIFPFVVKFDNLGAPKVKIIIILISTIILTWLIVLIFDFFLPMTDVLGNDIIYGYPFDIGPDHEVLYLWRHFRFSEFLMEWFGRYLTWGSVQQFLFMSYFLVLWRKVFPRSKGYIVAFGTSCIFGVIHAIDWPLMIFTAIA